MNMKEDMVKKSHLKTVNLIHHSKHQVKQPNQIKKGMFHQQKIIKF